MHRSNCGLRDCPLCVAAVAAHYAAEPARTRHNPEARRLVAAWRERGEPHALPAESPRPALRFGMGEQLRMEGI